MSGSVIHRTEKFCPENLPRGKHCRTWVPPTPVSMYCPHPVRTALGREGGVSEKALIKDDYYFICFSCLNFILLFKNLKRKKQFFNKVPESISRLKRSKALPGGGLGEFVNSKFNTQHSTLAQSWHYLAGFRFQVALLPLASL